MKKLNIWKRGSIRQQMILIFVGLILFLIAAVFVINLKFLEPYYIRNKKNEFHEMYSELNHGASGRTFGNPSSEANLHQMAEKRNMTFLVIDEDNRLAATNVHDMDFLNMQLFGYMVDRSPKDAMLLEATDTYQINRAKDVKSGTMYLEMWGVLENGYSFLVRSPLESIRDSAGISNRFLLMIGCGLIVICLILAIFFSEKITSPILRLAELSDHMANLDFEERYGGGGAAEINVLGDNFNRMSEKLESTISELKSANNALQKDIEQKEQLEQMRKDFLGNVSHELKTPIALIQGYAEGLKEGMCESPEDRQFYCEVIMDEADKMNTMVKNLLTLNQIEFGSDEIIFRRFNLTDLLQGVIASLEIMTRQEQVNLRFSQEKPVYVWADEYKVEQVIRNYLSNALHHVDERKIVDVQIHESGEKVRVTVFNTGRQIPESDIDHIWERFYKVDKAHSREYGGNGIGLSIVKAIMESLHQGYGVVNEQDGVAFWFELDRK